MSEADRLQELLNKELRKPIPDDDIVYALRIRIPYANSIDTERVRRGDSKIKRLLGRTHKESK